MIESINLIRKISHRVTRVERFVQGSWGSKSLIHSIKIRCLNLKWYPVSFTSHFRVERATVKLFSGVSFDVFQFSHFFFWATQDSISIIGLSLKTHRSRGSCRHSSPSAAHQRARFCENEKAKQLAISCLVQSCSIEILQQIYWMFPQISQKLHGF